MQNCSVFAFVHAVYFCIYASGPTSNFTRHLIPLSEKGEEKVGLLVVLRFNATLTAKVISWRWVTHTCFLAFFSFQSHRLLFSHASAEVKGENTPERKVASIGDRTHNHQVMSQTRSPRSPLIHLRGAGREEKDIN